MERIIRKAGATDIPRIMEIYAHARQFMADNRNPSQWVNGYPNESTIRDDLAQEQLYVCAEGASIVGVFCFFLGNEPDYQTIYHGAWLQDGPYGVVHRIASAAGNKGVASMCLDYAFTQCGDLRIDTHRDNIPMQRLLAKNGFHRCGIILLRKDGTERIAFQKIK